MLNGKASRENYIEKSEVKLEGHLMGLISLPRH